MAVSSMCIDKILQLLEGIEVDSPIHHEQWLEKDIAETRWAILDAQANLKLLRTLLSYTSKWSDDDKAEDLLSLLTEIEAELKIAETELSVDCAKANERQHAKILAVGNVHSRIVNHIQKRVKDAYVYLSGVSHPPVSDYIVFDEFVACLQAYLEILPHELDSYIDFHRRFDILPSVLVRKFHYGRKYPAFIPFSSTSLRECLDTIVQKLQILRYFIYNFSAHAIEKEKLQYPLARAGAVVFSIAHLSCIFSYERDFSSFPHYVFRSFSGLPEKISPRNPKVTEIYLGFLEGYVEILKAAKPTSGPFSSMRVEDVVNSFFAFIVSTKNQLDILSDALAFPLLDLMMTPEDYTKDVEVFLKLGITAVAREAGSLDFSICDHEMPDDKISRETSHLLSRLLHRIKLIKAEICLLELYKHKVNLMIPVEDRVAGIRKSMRFLGKFFETPEEYMEDPEKMILTLIEAVVREAGSLYTSCQGGRIMEDMMKESSLAIFKLFKAEAMLTVQINHRSSLTFLAKYRFETLHKGLICLRELLLDVEKDNLEDETFSTLVEAMASEATLLVCSFGGKKMEKDQPIDMNLLISYLPRKIELNSAKLEAIYQQGLWSLFSSFPWSDGSGFVDVPLGELRELLSYKPDTIAFMKDQVEVLLGEAEFLRSFLKDVGNQHIENKDLGKRVLCLIYETEYIIDLFVAGDIPLWYHQLVLFNAIEEAKLIKTDVLKFYNDKMRCDFVVQSVEPTSRHRTLEASNPIIDEVIVGFDDQAEILVDQLKSGSQQLQIVSIVGMPGLGKTTLSKKIYSSQSIAYDFIVRAWCYVSQVYRRRELLLDILADFVELTDQIKRRDDEDLALTLYQGLKRKRYLIVLDDIWSIEPWNDLKSLLPDDKNGSRVLLTSRLRDVALQINPSMEPHSLPLLSDEKSWELLQEKLFHGGSCPEQLLQAGGEIAKNCKGLPLAVVVVAGLLKRTDMNIYWWKEVAQSLRSLISHDQERQFTDILEFSYSHLPIYLKPCFLYLGAFLEDQEIPVNKLKWLWIAEGFVPKSDSKCSEETADDYLMDLISRSLVIDSKRRSKGGTKTCRMHDMLRDLCLKKASEENFMQLISTQPGGISQSYYPSDFAASTQYRLCVHSSRQHFLQSIPFGPHVHSLLFFAIRSTEAGSSHDTSFISHKFKLLRVLDLESLPVGQSFPNGIELMFRLSYLAIRGNINSVPSSIADLWNLETLIIKGMRGEVVLPETIWSMARLRHVQVNNRANFTLPSHDIEHSVLFANLVTFSSPVLRYGKETGKMLRRLIKLRKLRCIFMEHWDDYRKCNLFPALDSLTRLESLKIFYYGKISFPCEFRFPLNLKKLTLSKFCMPWKYISEIRGLPNLEVLKLASKAFEGRTWDMTELKEFPNLKFLKLEGLDIAIWNASSDHFPKLRQLVLQSCKKLEKVPSSFGEISTLEVIEMHWCTSAAASSICTIHKEQIDMGNEEFKVSISPAEWDFRKST